MPAVKKPTKILELNGAFKKNPKRAAERADEPIPTEPIGGCPDHLTDNHKVIWDELVANCVEGVLTIQDRGAFEQLVCAVYELRHGVTRMHPQTGDIVTVPASRLERDSAFRMFCKFGMTPSDRSNVQVPKKNDKPSGFKGGL